METKVSVILTAVNKASKPINQLKADIKEIGGVKVRGDTLTPVGDSARASSREVRNLKGDVQDLNGAISGIKSAVIGAFSIGAIKSFASSALNAAASAELLKKGLEFTLGLEQTEKLISNIQQIGEQSAYNSNDLIKMSRQWVNIGQNAEEATKKISTIVDVGSAYGLTKEQIEGANLALTQMQMAGKIGQQDMMQLLNAGIPAWQILSEKMGLSVEQLKDMSSKSQLTGDAIQALFDGMQEKTAGATSSMNNTLSAAFSNLDEVATNTMASVGNIIADAFNVKGISSELSSFLGTLRGDLQYIGDLSKDIGLKKAFEEQYGPISYIVALLGNVAAAYMAIRTAQMLCTAAQAVFNALVNANPWILAITVVIGLLMLAYQHIEDIKAIWTDVVNWFSESVESLKAWFNSLGESITGAITKAVNGIETAFTNAINSVKEKWKALTDFFAHPIDATVNVVRNVTERFTSGGAKGYAVGGVFGGLVPLATGGELKRGTPALVGEAGPEAVIPLKPTILRSIGRAIAESAGLTETLKGSYSVGLAGGSRVQEIEQRIKGTADIGNITEYQKILNESQRKAEEIGKAVKDFTDYQKSANEEASRYSVTGERTLALNKEIASKQREIEEIQRRMANGSARTDDSARMAKLVQEMELAQSSYEQDKANALKSAEEANTAEVEIKKNALAEIEELSLETEKRINSRSAALKEAHRQEQRAAEAASLDEYMAIMDAKDERTNQSYMTTLANQAYLQETMRTMYEEMMLAAVSWGTYMDEVLENIRVKLEDEIASGITECIMEGKSLAEVFNGIIKNILNTLLNAVIKKWITQLMTGGKKKDESSETMKDAEAERKRATAAATTAVAKLIAANPMRAWSAGLTVSLQMGIGAAAANALKFASGGWVKGAGTGKSDSIPAMLSNGEFVINADAAKNIGTPALNMINQGRLPAVAGGGTQNVQSNTVNLNVNAMDAGSFMDFLQSGGMDSIKQMLFDGGRNFTAESGVW